MFIPWRRTKKKKLAGQVAKQEWYHQFLDKDTDIKRLANKINSYFVGLTDHFPPLCQGVPPLSVPDEILISEYEAYKSLSSLQTLSSFLLLRLTVSETYLPPRKKLHWSQFGGFRKVEYVALQLGHLPVPLAVHFSFTADITYNAAKI